MYSCIDSLGNQHLASNVHNESLRILSNKRELYCPACKENVTFNNGHIKVPYFSHKPNSNCVIISLEREPESQNHILGKNIIYNFLLKRYPSFKIELEKYIPETQQIADVYLETTNGLKFVFEFQRSPISIPQWEARHHKYKEASIKDFWIFDASKYVVANKPLYSRRKFVTPLHIYRHFGFSYYLNTESLKFIIDYELKYSGSTLRHFPNECEIDSLYLKYGWIFSETLFEKQQKRFKQILKRRIKPRKRIEEKPFFFAEEVKAQIETDVIRKSYFSIIFDSILKLFRR